MQEEDKQRWIKYKTPDDDEVHTKFSVFSILE